MEPKDLDAGSHRPVASAEVPDALAPLASLSLDQLQVFLAVAEEGSFSAAARRLRRAQSAVSYAVGNLERLLDVSLFSRQGRTPTLTQAGEALLVHARGIACQVVQFQVRARSLARGVEPRLSLVADVMFPMPALVAAIGAFRQAFPTVSLYLHTEALGAVSQLVMNGVCRVGISGLLPRFPTGLMRWPMTSVVMVAVAAPGHPLVSYPGPIPTPVLQEHVQLVISDRSRLTEGIDLGVLSGRTWRLADLGAKHAFLRAGFGWGGMPLHLVEEDLAAGRLLRIVPAEWGDHDFHLPLFAVFRGDEPPGPAARWLLQRMGAILPEV